MTPVLQVPMAMARPQHVAVIMDGNGRWASERDLPRLEGHRRGADVVREITTFARELQIAVLTLYSFSCQNWRRPAEEVGGLMQLLEVYCRRERETLLKNDIRLVTIGSMARIPASTHRALASLKEETAGHRSMTLCLALDYGGREEIVAAARRLAADVQTGRLDCASIVEDHIEQRLDTAGLPPPDLVIRTSGDQRLSNFLLWQSAYAELHFTRTLWPDFTRQHFAAALSDYAQRERRFGDIAGPGLGPEPASPAGATPAPGRIRARAAASVGEKDVDPCS